MTVKKNPTIITETRRKDFIISKEDLVKRVVGEDEFDSSDRWDISDGRDEKDGQRIKCIVLRRTRQVSRIEEEVPDEEG